MKKYIAMARANNKKVFGHLRPNAVGNSTYSVVHDSEDGIKVRQHTYICHGHLGQYRGYKVKAVVECYNTHMEGELFKRHKRAVKMYLDYVLNRHCLSDVGLIHNVSTALKHGVPFNIKNYGDFAIRQYAITLRMIKESIKSAKVFEYVVDQGYSEHTAFIAFNLFAAVSPYVDSKYYYRGGYDHTFLLGLMKIDKVAKFLKTPYVDKKRVIPFSEPYQGMTMLHRTVNGKNCVFPPENGSLSKLHKDSFPSNSHPMFGRVDSNEFDLTDPRFKQFLDAVETNFKED